MPRRDTAAYSARFQRMAQETLYPRLPDEEQSFIRDKATALRLTQQELRRLAEIAADLCMWDQGSLAMLWPEEGEVPSETREAKKRILYVLEKHWQSLISSPKRYPERAETEKRRLPKVTLESRAKTGLGLGRCPVASQRTRCCNLLTLDAADNCGFGCSYCSIQPFFEDRKVSFDPEFREKLLSLRLDPGQIHHIGTGQSSDSLMWGNSGGILDALLEFARINPNVILELKTKSANIAWLVKQDIPANVICTWSLNTQTIIVNEEKGTASLTERIDAARRLADQGVLVGFHFHPMVHYDGWKTDYGHLFETVSERFSPSELAMLSLGTLTFTRPVIREIRSKGEKSRILQMPLVPSEGKLSYPPEVKLEMFSFAYRGLAAFQEEVFFYLCMENQRLWKPVFGFEYDSNTAFEAAMKSHYLQKIAATAITKS